MPTASTGSASSAVSATPLAAPLASATSATAAAKVAAKVASTFATTATATTSLTRRLHRTLFDLEEGLLLPLAVAFGLGSATRDKGVLVLVTLKFLGLGPLLVLLGVLVGSSRFGRAELEPLGRLLGQVVGIRPGVVFLLGLGRRFVLVVLLAGMMTFGVDGLGRGRIENSFFLVGLGNRLACLLVSPLGVTSWRPPALRDFLVGIRSTHMTVAIIPNNSTTTTASTSARSTAVG